MKTFPNSIEWCFPLHSFSGASSRRMLAVCALVCWLGLLLAAPVIAEPGRVTLARVPNDGIQPQAAVDGKGVVHLIYFMGKPGGGDIFYVRQQPGKENFSAPIQVNAQRGSAIAVGTIRGPQLAVGRNGRVHVAWNGSQEATTHRGAPMFYSRLNDAGTAFEPERDLIHDTIGLDGGGSVAADPAGNVYVMWHASPPDNSEGETRRAVYLAWSSDDGKTFAREKQVNPKPTGACGCCGMKAFADRRGNLFALYRAAGEKVNRDEILLVSRDHGATFEIANAHPWNVATCPMSSAAIAESASGLLAAWETAGQVYFMPVDGKTLKVGKSVAPPGSGKRKHPVAISNAQGDTLVTWAEGTGWQRGGVVAWQVFDASGQPKEKGRTDGVPVWSLVAAVARNDGSFVIFY